MAAQGGGGGKTVLIIILILIILVLCSCCCCSSTVVMAMLGELPDEYQDTWDEGDWEWKDYLEENIPVEDYYYDYFDDSYDSSDCSFPNGDVEYWWYDATEAEQNCYIELYGYPYFLDYDDSYYDDDSSEVWDNWCNYTIDCSHPNGDVEYWWDMVDESVKACFVYENGYPMLGEGQGGACIYPNGNVEDWWCETDEWTRLCYIDEYGMPWMFAE